METVQLQCGNCKKRMAIRPEYLGGQVQCPHCKSVVQTPAPQKAEPASSPPEAPNLEVPERESIWLEQDTGDAVIGDSPPPRVEMPTPDPEPESLHDPLAQTSPPPSDTGLPTFKPRPVVDKGLIALMALIFLVPYAIFTTIFLLYVILFGSSRGANDPLEYLRDPAPTKGGAQKATRREPKHDLPLSARLRTTVGQPIQAGELLVTPTRIRMTDEGDLQLVMRAKNTSANTKFEPIHLSFVKFDFNKRENKPYSFVEPKGGGSANIYGLDPRFHHDPEAKDEGVGMAPLKPNEEVTITLTTYEQFRTPHVANLVKSNEECLWRVQVRRGFVRVDRKDVSATMVIGVDFTPGEIEKSKKG